MNDSDKTKAQLITELEELQQKFDSLKAISDKDKIERSAVEKTLQTSEERFQLLFNKAPLGYQSLDINGYFIEVNQQWLDTLGYEREDVIGKWFGDFLTPMYQNGFRERFPIFKAQGHIHSEFEMVHKNGSILFIAFDGRIGNDVDGNFKQTHCILQDITESKLAKEALLESEERFKVLFEDAPDAIILGDLETELIVDANKEALQLFKCEKHQLIGMQHKDMHPRSNDDNHHESFVDHLVKSDIDDSKSIFESSIIASDGAIIPVDIMSQIVRIGDKDLYLGTLRDITERKKAEEALKRSEEIKNKMISNIGDVIVIIDQNGINRYKSPNITRLFGWQPEELVGKSTWDNVHADDIDAAKKVTAGLATKPNAIETTEIRYKCKDGKYVWIEITLANLLTDPDIKGLLGNYHDITERKKAEETLRKSEERYSNLLLHLETGIVVHAPDSAIITSNPRASELLGLTFEQMQGKVAMDPDWNFVNVDNTKMLFENYPVQQIINTKKAIKNQILGIQKTANHTIIWVNVNGFPVLNNDGKITEIVISFNDITNKINADKLLENERALYLDLVNTQPAGIYRIRVFPKENWENDAWKNAYTPPFKMELISNRFCEILGINQQTFELNPGIIIDLVHPDDKEEFIRRNEESNTLVTNFNWDCRLVINNKIKWIHFESLPRKLENGDILFTGIMYDISEQKKAEKDLQESEEKYRTIIETIPGVVYECDMDWNYIFASNGFKELTGFLASDIINNNIRSFVSLMFEDDIERINLSLDEAIKRNDQFYFSEYKLKTKSSDIVWVHDSVRILYNAKNEAIGYKGVILDITDRKNAEKALIESEELLSLYIKNSPIYSFIKEVSENESKVLYASENYIDMIGISGHEMIGKTMYELFPDEFAKKITADDWDVHKTSEVLKLDETLNGKDYITIKFPIVQGSRNLLAGFTIDISERKHAEELFIDIVDKNPMSIQIVDKEGYTLQTNPAFINLFGSIPPSYYSIFEDLISKGPEFETLIHQVISGEVVHLPDIYYNVHDLMPEAPNNPQWIRALIFPLKDSNGKPERFVIMHENITERKKAEEQISIQLNELRRWYEVTLDREGRVLELKREVNELLKMHGEALRYGSATEGISETISNV
jgi:PAS domain S-box-containing protein